MEQKQDGVCILSVKAQKQASHAAKVFAICEKVWRLRLEIEKWKWLAGSEDKS